MRVRRGLLAALSLGLLAAPGPALADGFVSAPGGPYLYDAQGRVLQLHGLNLVAKCPADSIPSSAPATSCIPGTPSEIQPGYVLTPDASDPSRRFTNQDAQTMANLGFTTVRLGIEWAGLEPGFPSVGPNDPRFCSPHMAGTPYPSLGAADPWNVAVATAYLDRVDVIVKILEAHGIRPLLDMHQDVWGPAFYNPTGPTPWMGNGAPAWATCADGAPTRSTEAQWTAAYLDAPVEAAFSHFWADDVSGNLQGHFDQAWAFVARYFRDDPGILGYEVFNEPADQTSVFPPEMDRKLECFYAGTKYAPAACQEAFYPAPVQGRVLGVIPAIQAADRNHLIFLETESVANYGVPSTLGATGELPFRNLVFSVHVYPLDSDLDPYAGYPEYSCESATCEPEDARIIAQYAADRSTMRTAHAGGPAWLLTEFGAHPYAPDLDHVAADAEAYGLGWMYWSAFGLHDLVADESLLDDRTRQPDPARALVLSRTYPLATAGTPLLQRFDSSTGSFTFVYRPAHAISAPTEIVVPLCAHYPNGYTATVTGGYVISPPDTPLMRVHPDRGSDLVSVSITARPGTPNPLTCTAR